MAYDDARDLLDSLEPEFKESLQDLEERLVRELDFLQRIHSALSGGTTISARTKELSEAQTLGFLGAYIPDLEIELVNGE